jgi:hypothetical protein
MACSEKVRQAGRAGTYPTTWEEQSLALPQLVGKTEVSELFHGAPVLPNDAPNKSIGFPGVLSHVFR